MLPCWLYCTPGRPCTRYWLGFWLIRSRPGVPRICEARADGGTLPGEKPPIMPAMPRPAAVMGPYWRTMLGLYSAWAIFNASLGDAFAAIALR
jgi:hypothetical protein